MERRILSGGLAIPLFMTALLLGGCSGIKAYPNRLAKNLTVTTAADSGSAFSSVKTAVDIYSVDDKCKLAYEGTVQLKKPSVNIGIPVGRRSYLDFVFATSGFLSSSTSTVTQGALLMPRKGYSYAFHATYKDNIYNVEMKEKGPKQKNGRNAELKDLSACSSR